MLGHASDNKHTYTNARGSLVFSLNFSHPLFTSAGLLLWGLLAGLELLSMAQRTRMWFFFFPSFDCFPLLTVEYIPTDTIRYLKQLLWENVSNSLVLKAIFWISKGCHPSHHNCSPIHWCLLGTNYIDISC